MASPADVFKGTHATKLRAEAETLREAARISIRLNCPSLASSLYRLADSQIREAKALTRVSAAKKEKNDKS